MRDFLLAVHEWFSDPRFGQERRFGIGMAIVVPLTLGVAVLLLFPSKAVPPVTVKEGSEVLTALPVPPAAPIRDALAMIQSGDAGGAINLLRDALVASPNDLPARRLMAAALMRVGRHGEAASEFTVLIARDGQAEDYYFRGLCFQETGKQTDAGEDFAEAARQSPSNPVYSNKNLIYLVSNNQKDVVVRQISEEMRLGIRSMMANWVVAAALLAFHDGREAEARQLLEEAGRIFSPRELSTLTRDPAFEPFLF